LYLVSRHLQLYYDARIHERQPFLMLWPVSGHEIFAALLKVDIMCKIMFSDITVIFVTYISFQFEQLM